MTETKWTKIGKRMELSIDGSVIRQERDLSDFIGADYIESHYGMVEFHFDDNYWYYCKDSFLIKMLEQIVGHRLI